MAKHVSCRQLWLTWHKNSEPASPVYVLFTKADKLPYFREYVDRLSEAEVAEQLGATLPLETPRPGVYAEEQSQRLTEAFQGLYYSLAEKRTSFLRASMIAPDFRTSTSSRESLASCVRWSCNF